MATGPIWLVSETEKIVTKIEREIMEPTTTVYNVSSILSNGTVNYGSAQTGQICPTTNGAFDLKHNGSDVGILTQGDIIYPRPVATPVYMEDAHMVIQSSYNSILVYRYQPSSPPATIYCSTKVGSNLAMGAFFLLFNSPTVRCSSEEEWIAQQAMMGSAGTAVKTSVSGVTLGYMRSFKYGIVRYNNVNYIGGTYYMRFNIRNGRYCGDGPVQIAPSGGFSQLNGNTMYPTTQQLSSWNGTTLRRHNIDGIDPENGEWGYLSTLYTDPGSEFEVVEEREFMERTGATIDVPVEPNPLEPGGVNDDQATEGDSGTGGNWDLNQDPADMDHALVDSSGLGLYSIYAMTQSQVRKLSDAMFTRFSEVAEQVLKSIFGSPLDAIISLVEYPMPITGGVDESIHFIWDIDNAYDITGGRLSSEYAEVDFGTITVPRYSNSFYDMEPYTRAQLYIPYIGFVDLIPSEIMGMSHAVAGSPEYDQCVLTIHGWMHLCTGEMCVQVESTRPGNSRKIIGSWSGMVGRMLPLSGSDFSDLHGQILKTGAIIAAAAATGGVAAAGAGAGAGAAAGAEGVAAGTAEVSGEVFVEGMKSGITKAIGPITSSSIGIAASMAPNVARQTHFTSGAGRCSSNTCFLVIEYPHQNVPSNQGLLGYATNTPGPLVNYSGYTEIRTIWLNSSTATAPEIDEIMAILKGGIIIG